MHRLPHRSSLARSLVLVVAAGVIVPVAPVLATNPRAIVMFNRGVHEAQRGDTESAIDAYTRAITIDPEFADAYNNRGFQYASGGDCHAAIVDYDKALLFAPRHSLALANRSWCRRQQGDLPGAIADLEAASRVETHNNMAFFHLGNLRYETGDFEGAKKEYEHSIRLDSRFAKAHEYLGCVMTERGAYTQALAHFARALELSPDDRETWENRAYSKRDSGDLEGAIKDFSYSARLEPERAVSRRERGKLYFDLGEYAAAADDLRTCCELDPATQDYPRLFLWLALTADGHRDKATADLTDHLKRRSTDADQAWYPALAGYLLGTVDEVKLMAEAAADDDPEVTRGRQCEARFYVGFTKLVSGQTTEATVAFRQCLETEMHDFMEYRSARASLMRLEKTAGVETEGSKP